jgi:hypothetical protein
MLGLLHEDELRNGTPMHKRLACALRDHFALYNCLVLGHTKYKEVQRVYCNPFPRKPFYGSHRLDPVMILPLGIEPWGIVVSPESVWYARVLLLFSASATTDTGSKSFNCALVSTMETYDDPENGDYYFHYFHYSSIHSLFYYPGWSNSVASQILYELDHRKPILYVIPIQNIIWKLCLVPVGDTGTIAHHLRTACPGARCRAPGDRKPGSGNGCRMWFVNSWAIGWSRDI